VSKAARAAPAMIDICAEKNGAERAHEKAGAEGRERSHQRGVFVAAGKECCGNSPA
jgi:hypothetical protein